MKKTAIFLITVFLLPLCLFGCTEHNGSKIDILCSIFPIYDVVDNLVSESDSVSLSLLCESSSDMHSYQLTASDIVKIKKCDIFIYVGGPSDSMIKNTLKELKSDTLRIDLFELLDGHLLEAGGDHTHDDHTHTESCIYDEHIWLSLRNMIIVASSVKDKICQKDPDNKTIYEANCQRYCDILAALDKEFQTIINAAPHKELVVADRFPFRYLFHDYGIECFSAFPGCSAESDASFSTVISLANKLNDLELSCVIIIDSSDNSLAKAVITASGKKDTKILTLDSMQSYGKKALKSEINYVDIMRANLEVLKSALEYRE